MLITESGIMVVEQPDNKELVFFSIIALQFPRESYTVFFVSTAIELRLLQRLNALYPICVTEAGIVMEVSPLSSKVLFPIFVTELGIVIDVKLVHLEKALVPILLTELEMETDAKLLQPLKT